MPLTTSRGGAASAVDGGVSAVAARFGPWSRRLPRLTAVLVTALACVATLMLGALLSATALGSETPFGAGLPASPRAVLSERALAAGQPVGSAGPLARVVLPTVVTGSATAITQVTATLNGTVNPNGGDVTECRFIYYGGDVEGEAPCSSLPGSGDEPRAVSAPIEGLEPDTEFGFELIASYGGEGTTGYGGEQSFTTRPIEAPTVVTGAASAVTQSSATVHATVNPNDGEVTDCYFEYGTTTNYTVGVECTLEPGSGTTPVSVSASLTVDLAPNTTYHYRIVARNAIGTSYGGDRTFKTPPDPPTVVTEAASAVTQTEATLNGTVNPNGGEVKTCRFEYGTSVSYGSSVSCAKLPGAGEKAVAVSATLMGLSADTTYHYRVVAVNGSGEGIGADQTFKTPPNPPTVVTGAASGVTPTGATLNGTVNPNGGEVTSCRFEWGTSVSYGSSMSCSPEPGSVLTPVAVSAASMGLSANTTYHFRVIAVNASGESHGADQTFKTPPNRPTVVTGAASGVTQSGATLNGTVNPNGGEVTSCRFEWGTSVSYGSSVSCAKLPGAGEKPVAVSAALTGLSADTTYHYRVVAVNGSGEGVGADQTFKMLASPVVDLVLPTTTSNQVGTNFSETATVTEGGVPLSGVPVKFTVTGANPQTGTVTTNEAGQATFAYTGGHAGTDHIVASFVDKAGTTEVSNEVTKTWIEPEPGGGTTGGGTTGGGTTGGGTTGGGTTGGGTAGSGGATGGGTTGGGGAKGGVLSFKELSPHVRSPWARRLKRRAAWCS
jgi:phosphodiesterase/alkaline phosphatase D-like protein